MQFRQRLGKKEMCAPKSRSRERIYGPNFALILGPTTAISALPCAWALMMAMTLPMSLMVAAPVCAIAAAINASNSASDSCAGKVDLELRDSLFLFSTSRGDCRLGMQDGFLARLIIFRRPTIRAHRRVRFVIHFDLLDRRRDHANHAQALAVLSAHGVLHVFGNSLFKRHRERQLIHSSARRAHIARDALHVTLNGSRFFALTFLGGLLVEFAPTQFGQHAGLFTGAFERRRAASKYSFSRTRTLGI